MNVTIFFYLIEKLMHSSTRVQGQLNKRVGYSNQDCENV